MIAEEQTLDPKTLAPKRITHINPVYDRPRFDSILAQLEDARRVKGSYLGFGWQTAFGRVNISRFLERLFGSGKFMHEQDEWVSIYRIAHVKDIPEIALATLTIPEEFMDCVDISAYPVNSSLDIILSSDSSIRRGIRIPFQKELGYEPRYEAHLFRVEYASSNESTTYMTSCSPGVLATALRKAVGNI